MGIQVNGNFVHWNYFLALEQDLAKLSRFVEFSEVNFRTYSIELAHLLLASSSEIDVVLRALCNMKNQRKDHQNINDYKETIAAELPELITERVHIHRYGLELKPWVNWTDDRNPDWWRSYNDVKHQRNEHFDKANLKNALNSVAALSLVTLYYYKEVFSQEHAQDFKDVTLKLRPAPFLIDFSDAYTHDHLVV